MQQSDSIAKDKFPSLKLQPWLKKLSNDNILFADAEIMNRDSDLSHTADDHNNDSPQYSALEMLNSHEKRAQRMPETRRRNFAPTARHLRDNNGKKNEIDFNRSWFISL